MEQYDEESESPIMKNHHITRGAPHQAQPIKWKWKGKKYKDHLFWFLLNIPINTSRPNSHEHMSLIWLHFDASTLPFSQVQHHYPIQEVEWTPWIPTQSSSNCDNKIFILTLLNVHFAS